MASTNPGVENVRAGIAYTIDDVDFVGTAEIPDPDSVLDGVPVDDSVGTVLMPTEAQVFEGVAFGANGADTGTLAPATNTLSQALLIGQAPPSIQELVLEITQGDSVVMNLKALLGPSGDAFDLTGAVFTTTLKGVAGIVSIPDAQHTANPDQVLHKGEFTLSALAANTDLVEPGELKEIVTKVVQGSSVIYFHGFRIINVLPKTPQA